MPPKKAYGENDFSPMRNIFNEWMVRDTSKKIKAVFRSKGMSGNPITSQPVYGYLKGEDGHFIIDEEAAHAAIILIIHANGQQIRYATSWNARNI